MTFNHCYPVTPLRTAIRTRAASLHEVGDCARCGRLLQTWVKQAELLREKIKIHSNHLKKQTKAAAPRLVEAAGIGFDIAAEMLITAGDIRDRVRSEAALTKIAAPSPSQPAPGRPTDVTPPPRRQPTGQRCPLPSRDRPDALAPALHRLRRVTQRGGFVRSHERLRQLLLAVDNCQSAKSSGASSATSPARSTDCSPNPPRATAPRPSSKRLPNDTTGWNDVDELALATLSWVHWFNTSPTERAAETSRQPSSTLSKTPTPPGVGI
jgi:hypothetical protein